MIQRIYDINNRIINYPMNEANTEFANTEIDILKWIVDEKRSNGIVVVKKDEMRKKEIIVIKLIQNYQD